MVAAGGYICQVRAFVLWGDALHELSLMEGIIAIARDAAAGSRLTRLTRIKLVVGAMTAAFPSALEAAFAALGTDSLFAGAVLEIENIPLLASCRRCGREFSPEQYRFVCPDCGSRSVDIIRGREFYIDYIEGE